MSGTDPDATAAPMTIDPRSARRVALGGLCLLAGAGVMFLILRNNVPPPPPEIAGNPRLVAGREVYLSRCVSCHGERGRGDGPIAKGLPGPPVGDLTDGRWKHGDRAEDVLRVVREGVPNTSMMGWGRYLGDESTRDVTAYILHLTGRDVPEGFAP